MKESQEPRPDFHNPYTLASQCGTMSSTWGTLKLNPVDGVRIGLNTGHSAGAHKAAVDQYFSFGMLIEKKPTHGVTFCMMRAYEETEG